jgi:hypothetical protein
MTEICEMSSKDLCLEGMRLFSIYDPETIQPLYTVKPERYFLMSIRKFGAQPSSGYYGWLACAEFLALDLYAKPELCTDRIRAIAFYQLYSRLEPIVARGYADAIINGVFGVLDYDEALKQISKLDLPIQCYLLGKLLLAKGVDHQGDIDAAVLLRFAFDVDPAEVNLLSWLAQPFYESCTARFESKSVTPEHAQIVIRKYIDSADSFVDYRSLAQEIENYFGLLDSQLGLLEENQYFFDGNCPACIANGNMYTMHENMTGGYWECPNCTLQATMLNDGFLGIEPTFGQGKLKTLKYDQNRWGELIMIRKSLFKGEQDPMFRSSGELLEYIATLKKD